MAEQSRQIKAGFEKEKQERVEDVRQLELGRNDLAEKADKLDNILSAMERAAVMMVTCTGKQIGRAYNECKCVSMIIGPLELEDGTVKCDSCNNECSRGQQFHASGVETSLDALTDHLDQIVTMWAKPRLISRRY